ncbi:glyoxalase [Sphaerisporangium rufum]|uniref:Glyoxalase n=1 Tax=Sphaerisporangium rufum TaxID=1381558 RepID=A0A919R0G4_9ACTN|nr:VOC family protein [Sphaerisporangium rufum]GII77389.1 glyoxalase [Sphaerisporangium rufum]
MIQIHTVTVDCADPYTLATWWSEVLGVPLSDEDQPGDPEVMLMTPQEPHVLFIQVPDGKSVKNRLHFDVVAAGNGTRDQETERLLAHGATLHEDHRRPDGTGWVTLRDPEGNEFCVCRNQVERAAG